MRRCCAIDCKKAGIHLFPKNPKIRKQWEVALRRKGYIVTKTSKLCSDHFTDDDYQKEGFYSGLKVKRKTLKKGVIPTQFAWSKEESKDEQRRKGVEKDITSDTSSEDSEDTIADTKACTSPVAVAADTNFSGEVERTDVAMVNEITASSSTSHDLPGFKKTSTREVGSQKNNQFFTIETFMENSKAIKFYTGLESYEKFRLIFSTLCPEVHSLKYRWSQVLVLSAEDQFLLTLIKLRMDKVDFELSFLFDISQTTVANIFVTWINFMHKMWSYNIPALHKMKRKTKALFRFLQEPICKKYLNYMKKINYVCQKLYNFNDGIIPW